MVRISGDDEQFDDAAIDDDNDDFDIGKDEEDDDVDSGEQDSKVEDVLVGMIQWYKDTLSPNMQPRCRFYPTCSSYGIASIKEFGPVKGLVLTAWRILRCQPFGGKGYDPPIWPPPFYLAGEPMSRALFEVEDERRAQRERRERAGAAAADDDDDDDDDDKR